MEGIAAGTLAAADAWHKQVAWGSPTRPDRMAWGDPTYRPVTVWPGGLRS